MDTIYLVVQNLDESVCSYGTKWGFHGTRTVIGIFQEEEQALHFLNNLKPSSKKKTKPYNGWERKETSYYLQKISKDTVLAITDDDGRFHLFPQDL